MISHISHVYSDPEGLEAALNTEALIQAVSTARSILVQIYSAKTEPAHLQAVAASISRKLPNAVVVGATTVGEIAHGRLLTNETVIGFTFFAASSMTAIALPCDNGDEKAVGAELGRGITRCDGKIAGVLLLSTTLSIDAAALLQGIESEMRDYPVFGGGAGDYAAMQASLVCSGSSVYAKGAVAVVLSGESLHIESKTYLGWRPLSKLMRVTEVDGLLVRSVDNRPAFDVYQRYLNIPNDQNFFLNALEFPFLIERDGNLLARVPVAVTEDGALQFVADVEEGATFQIGYGDLDLIVDDARAIHRSSEIFSPQAIFLYTCGCRRFLMQQDVELETLPFEAIAPTFGFYTYGEFFGSNKLSLLNSTMVAVGLREGPVPSPAKPKLADPAFEAPKERDPYTNKHARVVSRLMRFIDAVTSELETSNHEITKLSITDRLTQLANRIRLEQVLDENLQLAIRYGTPLSVILLDIDHFKQVNDTFGHMAGDDVLTQVAGVLIANTRCVDTVGRWGGEEFLVVAPNTGLDDAALVAEKLREAIDGTDFPVVHHMTSSFGVACYAPGDDLIRMISRADAALYSAKRAGRNRVELGHCQEGR